MDRRWYHPLLMFTWLTVGFAVVHVAICAWFIGIGMALWPDSDPSEQLQIDEDGEPLIQSWYRGAREIKYRRLDGTPLSANQQMQLKLLNGSYFYYREEGKPISWNQRICPFQDYQNPTTYWYHMEAPDRPGTSYFEGYDKATRRRIGYIGLNGFSMQRPDADQSFPIRTAAFSARHGVIASSQTYYGEVAEPANYNYSNQWSNTTPDAVWLLSADTIYEIRLKERTVRALPKKYSGSRYLTETAGTADAKAIWQLLDRTDTGLLIIDPETGEPEFIKLTTPPPSPGSTEYFYKTKNGRQILMQASQLTTLARAQQKYEILWLDEQGGVERKAQATLNQAGRGMFATVFAVCVPAPMISFGAWFAAPPLRSDSQNEPADYSQRFAEFAAQMWPWLISSLLVGIASGWSCWRRERLVFERSGWAWAILVGLCGWFGWVGYIFLRPLPARLPNHHWIRAQPEPNVPLGTEIFA